MRTGGINYFRGVYSICEIKSNDKFKYFNLINNDIINDCNLFTELIRLEKDNGFHESSRNFDIWLKFRNTSNWETCTRTGLAYTGVLNVYDGNISNVLGLNTKREVILRNNVYFKPFENPQHLIIAQLDPNGETLILDIFINFYPVQYKTRKVFIKEHQYYLNIKKGA